MNLLMPVICIVFSSPCFIIREGFFEKYLKKNLIDIALFFHNKWLKKDYEYEKIMNMLVMLPKKMVHFFLKEKTIKIVELKKFCTKNNNAKLYPLILISNIRKGYFSKCKKVNSL